MALRGIQEYIARDVNNIARVEDDFKFLNGHFTINYYSYSIEILEQYS